MRSIIAAAVVAFLLVSGAVGYAFYVDNTAAELKEHTNIIESAVIDGNFEFAKEYAQQLDVLVDKKKEILGAISDHEEIYEIKRTLGELICLAEEEETADCRAHCAAICALVDRLAGNSSPAIFNIL